MLLDPLAIEDEISIEEENIDEIKKEVVDFEFG